MHILILLKQGFAQTHVMSMFKNLQLNFLKI
jgi:hypothetical protein